MGRRAGQIIPRGERKWRVRWYIGTNADTGKRRYGGVTVQGTKRDAERVLRELHRQSEGTDFVGSGRTTLKEWMGHWLDTSATMRLRARTVEDYRYMAKRYVYPTLGPRRLSRLTSAHVEKWISTLVERGLSPQTVRQSHAVVSAALRKAMKHGLVYANAAAGVDLPKKKHKEVPTLTPEEIQRFRDAATSDRHHVFFELMIVTGARPSELRALRWCDVDLSQAKISIVRSVSPRAPWLFEDVKRSASRRTIPIPEQAARLLRAHRGTASLVKINSGASLVFANELGHPLDHDNLSSRHFKKILSRAGLRNVPLYSLRHSHATLLLERGVPLKVAAERLGHSSIRQTADTYQHVTEGMQERATAEIGAALYGR